MELFQYRHKFGSLPAFIKRLTFRLGATPRRPHPERTFASLPNELLLEIFSFLELQPYIICHGVCKKWRQLLPLAKLDPIRQRLLNLYHRILDTPGFEATQEWTTQNLQSFDREGYICCLLQQYPVIPEAFRIWILEWPARLLIQCTWPGLPFRECPFGAHISQTFGVNWIAYRSFSPRLSSLLYKYDTPSETFIPGLLIWRQANDTVWLIFSHDEDEPGLFGRVFYNAAEYHEPGTIPFYPRRTSTGNSNTEDIDESDEESVISDGERFLLAFDDWIHYLEFLWDQTVREIRHPREPRHGRDSSPIPQPILCRFNSFNPAALPAQAWDSCQRTSPT